MSAPLPNGVLIQNQDFVTGHHRGDAVGHDDGGAVGPQLAQPGQNLGFGDRIHRRQGVVQDQDHRMADQRPGDGDALLLAAGEVDPPLAQDRIIAVRQPRNALVDVGVLGRLDHLIPGVDVLEEPDVGVNGVMEQEVVLGHITDVVQQDRQGVVVDILAIQEYFSVRHVVDFHQQVDQGGFA